MTRYEALNLAIAVVRRSTRKDKNKIIEGLQHYVRTRENRKWSEENIFAFCDKVIAEKGRLLVSDLGHDGAPGHGDIAQAFGMQAGKFRDTYYPIQGGTSPMSRYFHKTTKEWTQLFIEDYKRIQPRTQTEYNEKRGEGLPRWNMIAKWNDCTGWKDLLALLGLRRPTKMSILSVEATSPSIEEYKALKAQRETYRDFAFEPVEREEWSKE